jgi:hypothetical protein
MGSALELAFQQARGSVQKGPHETVRYESALDYLPSVFSSNHAVDISLQKHVMDIALPGDRDVKLGIVYRQRAADAPCMASK